MDKLLRDEIKYVRDRAKSLYTKETECYICGSTTDLQMHHYFSMTGLWNKWKKEKNITIENTDDILLHRDSFIEEHHDEVYDEVVTLCKQCHMSKLHKIYGQSPLLHTAKKQKRWAQIQRDKRLNK